MSGSRKWKLKRDKHWGMLDCNYVRVRQRQRKKRGVRFDNQCMKSKRCSALPVSLLSFSVLFVRSAIMCVEFLSEYPENLV